MYPERKTFMEIMIDTLTDWRLYGYISIMLVTFTAAYVVQVYEPKVAFSFGYLMGGLCFVFAEGFCKRFGKVGGR